jgi:hypothetical protein
LTHENLKDLGVTAIGHRLKLDAIAALRSDASGAPLTDAAITLSTPSAHPEDRAERRQVSGLSAQRLPTEAGRLAAAGPLREIASATGTKWNSAPKKNFQRVAVWQLHAAHVNFAYPNDALTLSNERRMCA